MLQALKFLFRNKKKLLLGLRSAGEIKIVFRELVRKGFLKFSYLHLTYI